MVEGVLSLDRLPVREIMTPRAKIIWINQADPHDAIWLANGDIVVCTWNPGRIGYWRRMQ